MITTGLKKEAFQFLER